MASFGVRQGGFTADSNSYVTVGQLNQVSAQEQNDVAALNSALQTLAGQIGPPPNTAPPANTVAPSISGVVATGNTLICARGTWTNSPTAYAFQWFDDTTPISGATAFSYVVVSGDTTHTITCQVTASNLAGSATAVSNGLTSSGSVPTNTVAPVASGTVASGNVLTCSTGTWAGSPSGYTFQWYWDVSTPISGATNPTYTVVDADLTHTLNCQVTATNANGNNRAFSNGLTAPAPPQGNPPVNTAAPIISGTVSAGQVLTCTQGTWSNTPTGYTYQWYDDTAAISGATASTYTVVSGDVTHTVTCKVTASNAYGTATATSNGLVAAGNAPVNTVAPVASGTVAAGNTLTVTNGTWNNGVTTYAYQWCDDGTPISGATSSSYTVQTADLTATITCKVTASNAYGAVTKASNGLVAVPSGFTTLWVGDTTSKYGLIQTAPTDSYGPRFYQTTAPDGTPCLAFVCVQTDYPTSTNPRAQALSPTNIIKLGNTYRFTMSIWVPSGSLLHPWNSGFMEFWELYGMPEQGSPPVSIKTDDGKTWGLELGAQAWGGFSAYGHVAEVPITYDQWNDWIFDVQMATSGNITVTYNGTQIFTATNFPCIIASDNKGPWDSCIQVYMQRNMTPGQTKVGPIYFKNHAIQQNTGAPSGSAPTNSVAPVASGTVATGSKLSVTNGTWANTPTSYTYQWFANGAALAGQTGNTYAVTSGTSSANIFCEVTASNAYGSAPADSNTLTGSGGTVQPNGPTGTWNLTFDDEFTGSSLDTTKWNPTGWRNNGMTNGSNAANVTVGGGVATLICPSAGNGAQIESIAQPFAVGDFVEFRANFSNANWPAVWTSGASWPSNGEVDVAELLGGGMSINYHWGTGGGSQAGPFFISGTWTGGYHTFGAWRKSGSVLIYWDGVLKETITTSDSGGAHYVIMTNGDGGTHSYGSGSPLLVDYVRVWTPAA